VLLLMGMGVLVVLRLCGQLLLHCIELLLQDASTRALGSLMLVVSIPPMMRCIAFSQPLRGVDRVCTAVGGAVVKALNG